MSHLRNLRRRPLTTASAALLAVILVSFGATLRSALREVRLPAPSRGASDDLSGIAKRAPGPTTARLAAAVDNDPFRSDRQRPRTRFRLPGEAEPMPEADDQEPASRGLPVALRLLGTVVSPGGEGFAMCQLGQEPPKLVRPGARIGPLTLRSVAQGRALFLSPEGDELEVRVSNNND